MAIFSSKIPKNATNISMYPVMLYLDEENIDIFNNNITFQHPENLEEYERCINVTFTSITEDGTEITVSRITN